jgi:c-di-GMP-binding flagellar brake protein YcgR
MRGRRIPLSLPVTTHVTGFPKPIPAMLVDLSEGGCRISASSVFLIGAGIEFRLQLSERNAPVIRGKIVRCNPTDVRGTLDYGVEFSPLSLDALQALRLFIDEEDKRSNNESRAARVEIEFPVECTLSGQKNAIRGLAIDLGSGGMRMACTTEVPEGSTVTLRFALPNDRSTSEIAIRGRIVHRKHHFREYHYSIAFLEPDARIVERIERVLQASR